MADFFERFGDWDKLKAQAEDLIQDGLNRGRRQATLAKLRLQMYDLDRRMGNEFRVLGEQVWKLHEAGTLNPESLAGAFTLLEALSDEIEDTREDMQELLAAAQREAAESDEPATGGAPPPAGTGDVPEPEPGVRKIEGEPPAAGQE